jgi:hypothetical protein
MNLVSLGDARTGLTEYFISLDDNDRLKVIARTRAARRPATLESSAYRTVINENSTNTPPTGG